MLLNIKMDINDNNKIVYSVDGEEVLPKELVLSAIDNKVLSFTYKINTPFSLADKERGKLFKAEISMFMKKYILIADSLKKDEDGAEVYRFILNNISTLIYVMLEKLRLADGTTGFNTSLKYYYDFMKAYHATHLK